MKMRTIFSALLFAFMATTASAQQSAATFKVTQKQISANEIEVTFAGQIQKGWHVYSTALPDGGPTSATFTVDSATGIEATGDLLPKGKELNNFDKLFSMQVRYFLDSCRFVQRFKTTAPVYELKGHLTYGSCNDVNCLPPTDVPCVVTSQKPAAKPAARVAPRKKVARRK